MIRLRRQLHRFRKDLGILQQELGSVTTLAEYVNTISENVTTAKERNWIKINVTDLETEASNQAKRKKAKKMQ